MSNSQSILAFRDIEDVLNRAVASANGLRLTFPDVSSVHRWVVRAHKFRAEHRKLMSTTRDEADPLYGTSPFDILLIRKDENKVVIEFRATATDITVEDLPPRPTE